MDWNRKLVVFGLALGDEAKGATVDALARRVNSSLVVRYNGAPQAGHNAVAPDGTWHCFAQFGAGSLVEGSHSLLSAGMLVDLGNMDAEAEVLQEKVAWNVWSRLVVDPDCLLITPMQKYVGRMREIARGGAALGSCGMGVGETVRNAEAGASLRVRDMLGLESGFDGLHRVWERSLSEADAIVSACGSDPHPELLALQARVRHRINLTELSDRYRRTLSLVAVRSADETIRQAVDEGRVLIFEGAQGALLDRTRGFVPHVTKTDTTCRNALDLLSDAGIAERPLKIGVLRAYGHRHGAGPFVTEDPSVRERFDDRYNPANRWQGAFRVGWLDLPALRYGIRMNGGVDALSLTGLDRLSGLDRIRVCAAYHAPDDGRLADIPDLMLPEHRTALVAACAPEWIELPGWNEDLSGIRRWDDLPENAKAYVRFLEGPDALGAPVAILSVGPTADHRIFR